jgi:hypothetical protein
VINVVWWELYDAFRRSELGEFYLSVSVIPPVLSLRLTLRSGEYIAMYDTGFYAYREVYLRDRHIHPSTPSDVRAKYANRVVRESAFILLHGVRRMWELTHIGQLETILNSIVFNAEQKTPKLEFAVKTVEQLGPLLKTYVDAFVNIVKEGMVPAVSAYQWSTMILSQLLLRELKVYARGVGASMSLIATPLLPAWPAIYIGATPVAVSVWIPPAPPLSTRNRDAVHTAMAIISTIARLILYTSEIPPLVMTTRELEESMQRYAELITPR